MRQERETFETINTKAGAIEVIMIIDTTVKGKNVRYAITPDGKYYGCYDGSPFLKINYDTIPHEEAFTLVSALSKFQGKIK